MKIKSVSPPLTQTDWDTRIAEPRGLLSKLREEEARLVRLLLAGKMSEETYDQVRTEWQEKVRHVEANLAALEHDMTRHLDDLDLALILLTRIHELYPRLADRQRARLLQILAKRIIVDADGEIIGCELHSPFAYLSGLVADLQTAGSKRGSSEQIHAGALCLP